MVCSMKLHTHLTGALFGALLIAGATTSSALPAQASRVAAVPMKTASAAGNTQNTRSTVLLSAEQTSSAVVTATLDVQVVRRTPTFNRQVTAEPKWQLVTTGCKAPIVSKPTAVYPVPSPTLVVAPRSSSTCVSGNTVTTFSGAFSFNANFKSSGIGGDRMKTVFRLDLPKGSKLISISAFAAITEYSGNFTAGSRVPLKTTSRLDLKNIIPF